MPTRRTLSFITLCVFGLVGCSRHYRDLADPFGLRSALDHRLVADGDTIDLYLSDPETKKPLAGLTIHIGTGKNQLTAISRSDGHLSLPASRTLLESNPPVSITRLDGGRAMSLQFIFTGDCRDLSKPAKRIDVSDAGKWAVAQSGPDRVYSERDVSADDVAKVVELLAQERRLLTELAGANPPAMAVALMREEAAATSGLPDGEGRTVWPFGTADLANDRQIIGTLVHEWMHSILHDAGFDGSAHTRFIEDGLCELVAHQVESRVRGRPFSQTSRARLEELNSRAAGQPKIVNLLELSERFDVGRYGSGVDAFLAMCRESELLGGYSLGLAFWLDRLDSNPDVTRQWMDQLRRQHPDAVQWAAAANALPHQTIDAQSVAVADALVLLARHAGP